MTTPEKRELSSRELLDCIGLGESAEPWLLDDEFMEDLSGDPVAALKDRLAALLAPQALAVGDVVQWKPGMKNRRAPRYGQPAIVVEVLAQPVSADSHEPGSTYFREPLDVVLGVFWHEKPGHGEFLAFHYDSRRLERVNPEVAQ